ncbi:MAG: IclR family transcriptional regulator [Actinomycetota bacterium]
MLGGRPADLIQSVSRALRILEEIGNSPQGLNAKEVSGRCGVTLATAYHLLRTLCYEGYLTRRPGGSYALGLEIADRFREFVASMHRPPGVHEVLRHLAETTRHTAYFAQLVDGRILLTDLFEGPKSPHLEDLVVGFHEGAHATAIGKALLSSFPQRDRQCYLRESGLRPFTRRTIVDATQLEWELRGAARMGLFTEYGQFRDGVCCAAVLVGGECPGTIGFSSLLGDGAPLPRHLVDELRWGAADLSRAGLTKDLPNATEG